MAAQGWQGAFLRRGWRGGSTPQDPRHTSAPDLVNRNFAVAAPNRLRTRQTRRRRMRRTRPRPQDPPRSGHLAPSQPGARPHRRTRSAEREGDQRASWHPVTRPQTRHARPTQGSHRDQRRRDHRQRQQDHPGLQGPPGNSRAGRGSDRLTRCGSRNANSGSPTWTRTKNLPVNSRLLCQLSYRGSQARVVRISPRPGRLHKTTQLPQALASGYLVSRTTYRGPSPHRVAGRTRSAARRSSRVGARRYFRQ
jgi:hypothetical protein